MALICFACFWFLKLQVWEVKPVYEKKDVANGSQKSLEVASVLIKDPSITAHSNGDLNLSENGSETKSGDAPKSAKPVVVSEKRVLSNGIANGC